MGPASRERTIEVLKAEVCQCYSMSTVDCSYIVRRGVCAVSAATSVHPWFVAGLLLEHFVTHPLCFT